MDGIGSGIGKLGFGLMRLPMLEDSKIDIEQTKTMVDLFMEAGFTYFDTAWAYAGSEDAIRQALVERYPRESFQLATKNAAWINCSTREEAVAQFDTSLKQTGAGYIDYYLLHNLGEHRTKFFDDFDMWSFVRDLKAQGKVRHIGFSAHCRADELEQIIVAHPEAEFSAHCRADELEQIIVAHPEAEFVQLQINYADWESPSIESRKCYEVARRHGLPVIIMEPVKGGMLASPPQPVRELLEEAEPGSTPASWALRFAADLDGVITVLSGMSNVEQMEENIAVMKGFEHLSEGQRKVLEEARVMIEKYPVIPCTSCEYCSKVCPKNIGISGTFYADNLLTLYSNLPAALNQEGWLVGGHGKARATECIKCGKCEDACPQHIAIRDMLDKSIADLGLQ